VDLVALSEDEVRHLRIPVSCLVSEMDASLQHLTHRDRHCFVPFRVEPRSAAGPVTAFQVAGHPESRICEFQDCATRVPVPRSKLTFDFNTLFGNFAK